MENIVEEKYYKEAKKGISMFSSELITIIGERKVVIDGELKEQYIYNIDNYEAKNGKPFVSLKANIVLM